MIKLSVIKSSKNREYKNIEFNTFKDLVKYLDSTKQKLEVSKENKYNCEMISGDIMKDDTKIFSRGNFSYNSGIVIVNVLDMELDKVEEILKNNNYYIFSGPNNTTTTLDFNIIIPISEIMTDINRMDNLYYSLNLMFKNKLNPRKLKACSLFSRPHEWIPQK